MRKVVQVDGDQAPQRKSVRVSPEAKRRLTQRKAASVLDSIVLPREWLDEVDSGHWR
jgi:hypothetical protein